MVCENHGISFYGIEKGDALWGTSPSFDGSETYFAKLTARVSRITVIFTCPG